MLDLLPLFHCYRNFIPPPPPKKKMITFKKIECCLSHQVISSGSLEPLVNLNIISRFYFLYSRGSLWMNTGMLMLKWQDTNTCPSKSQADGDIPKYFCQPFLIGEVESSHLQNSFDSKTWNYALIREIQGIRKSIFLLFVSKLMILVHIKRMKSFQYVIHGFDMDEASQDIVNQPNFIFLWKSW